MNIHAKPAAATILLAMISMAACAATPSEDQHAGHHPEASTAASGGKTAPAATPDAPADAVANMKKMQAQMAAIAKTTDPKERAKLLDEHMQTMTATMQSMQKAAGGMKMGEGGMPMQGGGGMGMMPMMQMMMEQMMEHQGAMAPAPAK